MTTYTGELLNGYGEIVGGGLVVEDGVVTEILPSNGDEAGWITPGFVDIHCHGGGGASFPDDHSPEGVATAVAAHLDLGTTALVASTVSMIDPLPAINNLVRACEAGTLLGIHMEGPYISPHKCGAQNPAAVRNPDLDELRTWLEAGKGWIKTMTIAPELEGAAEAAQMLINYGALPSWGHTNASGKDTRARLAATTEYGEKAGVVPAQTATHLFNAMPSLLHREPGPVRELIQSARAGNTVVELVADAVHVHPDLVSDVVRYVCAGDDGELGVIFVTDAMAGAGMPDGDYVLGALDVVIKDGVARLKEGDSIAGGTARLAEEIQRMVNGGYLTMSEAVRACVAAPAHAIRAHGSLGVTLDFAVGERPNLVTFDDNLEVTGVVREGVTYR